MAENAQIQAWQTNLKGKIHPAAQNAFRLLYDAIQDHDTAIVALNTKVESLTPTTPVTPATPTTPTTPTSGSFPYLGDVNSQTGNAYTTALTDNGGLIVLSFAGTVAVTLTSGVTAPFFVSILNLATGTATLTPSTGNISYTGHIAATSMPILSGGWAILYFDGTNWWSLTAFTTPTGAANLVYATPNGSSGAATLRALVPADAPFAVVSVAGSAPITSTGGTSPTIAVNLATSGTVGVVKPDGTTTTVNGAGAISAAVTPQVYKGDGSFTCVGGESVVTVGSTPVTNSVKLFLNGVLLNINSYTLSGSVATLSGLNFGVNDVVRATWDTLNSTPGTITVTNSGIALHSFQTSASSGGLTPLNILIPAGASAGDFAVMCLGWVGGFLPTTPSGWTLVDGSSGSGTFWNGGTYSKTLSSGDIATGYVAFTGSTGFWTGSVVTFSGAASIISGGIVSSRAQGTPATVGPTSSATAGNTAIYFGSQGATPGGSSGAVTWNRGILRSSSVDSGNCACGLYTEQLASGGTVTGIVTYASPTAAHNFQTVIVVNTVATTPGTIPQLDESQVVGLPAFIASAVTTLTTAGSSGAATLVGNTLNVPQYTGGGGGGGSLILLEQHTASASASLLFTGWYSASYDVYQIELVNVLPSSNTGSNNLQVTLSANGGSSYLSSGYQWANQLNGAGNDWNHQQNAAASSWQFDLINSQNANLGICATAKFYPNTSGYTAFHLEGMHWDTSNHPYVFNAAGSLSASGVNAFKVAFANGNIASGTIRIYGLSH